MSKILSGLAIVVVGFFILIITFGSLTVVKVMITQENLQYYCEGYLGDKQ